MHASCNCSTFIQAAVHQLSSVAVPYRLLHFDLFHSWVQIYASYKYRRDLAEAAKSPDACDRARPMTDSEARSQDAYASKDKSKAVPLDPPTMRQAIGWELALRSIRQHEVGLLSTLLFSCPSHRQGRSCYLGLHSRPEAKGVAAAELDGSTVGPSDASAFAMLKIHCDSSMHEGFAIEHAFRPEARSLGAPFPCWLAACCFGT